MLKVILHLRKWSLITLSKILKSCLGNFIVSSRPDEVVSVKQVLAAEKSLKKFLH